MACSAYLRTFQDTKVKIAGPRNLVRLGHRSSLLSQYSSPCYSQETLRQGFRAITSPDSVHLAISFLENVAVLLRSSESSGSSTYLSLVVDLRV